MAFELNRDLPSGVSGNYWKISSALVACNTDNPSCDVYLELFLTRQARIDGKAPLLTTVVGVPLAMVDMSFSFDFRACLYNTIKSFPDWSTAVDIFDDPNLIPVANNVNLTTEFETAKNITFSAYDNFNAPITISVVDQPTNGTITELNGVFTYTPNTDYSGSDLATYKAANSQFESAPANINISVADLPGRPTASDTSADGIVNNPVSFTFAGNDPNGLPLTFSIVDNPTNGLVLEDAGIWTYQPNLDFSGSDTFTYKANNGTLDSKKANIVININIPDVNIPGE